LIDIVQEAGPPDTTSYYHCYHRRWWITWWIQSVINTATSCCNQLLLCVFSFLVAISEQVARSLPASICQASQVYARPFHYTFYNIASYSVIWYKACKQRFDT